MAHTPGPYIIAEPGGPAGPFYGLVNDKGNVVAMQILRRDDALLLHAAPDLLAACKTFLQEYEDISSELHFGQMLDSAFADILEPMYAAINMAEPDGPPVPDGGR